MKRRMLWGVALAVGLMAGCATDKVEEPPTFEPTVAAGDKDPNPFADYGAGMANTKEFPLAVNWQDAHKAEVAAATKPETLRKFLASDEAARTLLAEVKEAYTTDPIVMIQIGAISQLVMCPRCPDAPALRARWTGALLERIRFSQDVYHVMFCLDQLRWCGRPEDAKALRKLAANWEKRAWKVKPIKNGARAVPEPQTEEDKAATRRVREFMAQVEREIAK